MSFSGLCGKIPAALPAVKREPPREGQDPPAAVRKDLPSRIDRHMDWRLVAADEPARLLQCPKR
jgi:hypothetical protein